MRLATFNVENMFERVKAMNLDTWEEGEGALLDFSRLNSLIQQDVYTDAIKAELLAILKRHPGLITQQQSQFIRLRIIRGKFISQANNQAAIAANGREDWIGWFELEKEAINESAIENTGRIIGLLEADVLCVVEAENRLCLKQFNENILPNLQIPSFSQTMLIDGNDARGIDVGILTKPDFEISRIRSHIFDADETGIIFSRDCAEYEISTKKGNNLLVMVNHFKSKGYGQPAESAQKRLRQARRVREIYEQRLLEGYTYIAITGDFNEIPANPPMDPLIRENSSLLDIMVHPAFVGDGREGTHGNGTASAKLDYIFMSPKLVQKIQQGGIERRGVWGGKNGTLFPHLDTIHAAKEAASDHAALWVEIDI